MRVHKRAKENYLAQLVEERLARFGLSSEDLIAAATDAGSNVLLAVDLMGIQRQKCFVHGLDLVVRRVVHGKKALGFNIEMLSQPSDESDVERGDSAKEEETDETEAGFDSETEAKSEEEEAPPVSLGPTVENFRGVVKMFKKRRVLMDEIRQTTARAEYNGKALRPELDCRTRWYSTLVMIDQALRILPAPSSLVMERRSAPVAVRLAAESQLESQPSSPPSSTRSSCFARLKQLYRKQTKCSTCSCETSTE